ncbi:unnamed protein product [Cyprideis torosa]|uniref:Structure-specific endonuclease subunit SLX1 homolog n=1 Tax=Cyprideis torosa TaxID=163714 RepID=A0A7R8ZNU6_9CRUS|nr:unnamed protein product [Cyprideis torosa]CAG0897196.1 unnamed protein product [Cyprideis torosa]
MVIDMDAAEPDGLEEDQVGNFHGVYLLLCQNPRFKGRCYVGYTVDPSRRIKQHNKGRDFGGASRTSDKGPWEMVLIVHGFPSDIAALKFEWNWQHPQRSPCLRGHLNPPKKKARELRFPFHLRVMATMLRISPWNRLPLSLRWLRPQYQNEFPAILPPPSHMVVCEGAIKPMRKKPGFSKTKETEEERPANEDAEINPSLVCGCCLRPIRAEDLVHCTRCLTQSHLSCLADTFLDAEPTHQSVPLSGSCPFCEAELLWGDLISQRKTNSEKPR